MAERANPDDPSFHDHWKLERKFGILPWIRRISNPYRAAFEWRYGWAQTFCRGRSVLDVPCGMGWGTSLLAEARETVGLDRSEEAIAEAKRRYGGQADFMVGDMSLLPFEAGRFEVVICLEGIEHAPREVGTRFLSECARVLAPDGEIVLSSPYCPAHSHSGNPFHLYEYMPEEIRAELEIYFNIEEEHRRQVDEMTVHYFHGRKRLPGGNPRQ